MDNLKKMVAKLPYTLLL